MNARNGGFLYRLLAGVIIGLALIIPGVSGGVVAIMLGLYHQIVTIIAHPLEDLPSNIRYLLPLALGGILSVLLFSNVLKFLILNYPFYLLYLFTGLLAGSLPAVFGIANKKGFEHGYVVAFLIGLVLALIPLFVTGGINLTLALSRGPGFNGIVISGFLLAVGTIIPGISASFLLMLLGTYRPLLNAVATANFGVLVPVGAAFFLSLLIVSRITHYLFQRYYGWTYYGLLGILLGSAILVFPGLPHSFAQGFFSVLLLLGGALITLNLQEN